MENVEYIDKDSEPSQGKSPAQWQKYWTKEVEAAQKRLRKFYKQGNDIVRRYVDKREGDQNVDYFTPNRSSAASRLNLFHTNVSTLQSMLYGSVPRIDVAREHHDPDDDIARVAATLYQRILQADVDPSGKDLPSVLKAALQDRLLPGLGIARVRYEVETEMVSTLDPNTLEPMEVEQTVSEDAPIDYIHWQDFIWGWCRTWDELPWMGFRAWLTKEEATARFGKKKANKLEYKNQLPTGENNRDQTEDKDQRNNIQKAEIWEIWQMSDKQVFWWSQGCDYPLDVQDDPLQLDGFWPVPKPMLANCTTTLMVPTADYILAQDLYNQIDELNTRIQIITRAIKVVGVYDKSASDSVGRMLKEGVENDLIPVDNWAMFAEKGGLAGSIDWFPVQEVVGVLQTLKQVLGETIELLYQVTGMSDILRGANTDQYTSDGTNQLKAKFGSIRVQALQDEFARFASDLEGLKAEVISKHFDPQTIYKISSAQFMPRADQDKVGPAIQLMQTPDLKWRVDIRPESIAMVDYAQLKQERTEFLNAMATYIQSAQAAAKEIPGSLPILLEMLKWGMAGFKGSNYLEGTMDVAIQAAEKAAQNPQQQDDGKGQAEQAKLEAEKIKQQTEQMKIQGSIQKIQAKAQADMQLTQQKLQAAIAEIQADANRDQELENLQSQYALLEVAEELQAKLQEVEAELASTLTVERSQADYDMEVNEQEHMHRMRELNAQSSQRPGQGTGSGS